MKRKLTVLITALALMAVSVTGCKSTESDTYTTSADSSSQGQNVQNEDDETDTMDFMVTLYSDYAPITCENFENLVSEGFYNGLTFHRVVEDFMAQGGDPMGTGMGGSEKTIKGEFMSNGVDNKLSHKRGVISMARSSDPDSASSQFFICYVDTPFLDGNYAAFGEVTEGMEVIDAFLSVPRSYNMSGELASPDRPIVIKEAVMADPDENGNHRVHFTMEDFLN